MQLTVPFFRQQTDYTCGPACLRMLFAFHKMRVPEDEIAELAGSNPRSGTPDKALLRVARLHGFSCRMSSNALWTDVLLSLRRGSPVLIKYREPSENERHFALIVGMRGRTVLLHDPWNGSEFSMDVRALKQRWLGSSESSRGWMMTVMPKAAQD